MNKNIEISGYNNVVFMNIVIEMKIYIIFFQTIANTKLINL